MKAISLPIYDKPECYDKRKCKILIYLETVSRAPIPNNNYMCGDSCPGSGLCVSTCPEQATVMQERQA
ncbi:MAG: hypothetical protein A4E35_00726 [Methanoregula sp. PtaU1.Bin051]|nr:MAG: hypothetical protein A4E35_00726 [Methanoregula sp. PtaU1.Bin051]